MHMKSYMPSPVSKMRSMHVSDYKYEYNCGWFKTLAVLKEHRMSETGAILNTKGAPRDKRSMESLIPGPLNDASSSDFSGWTFWLPWCLD